MSDFKTEYPVLYFNEYFKRKPMRLNERESEELFTLEETDVNNFEYISLHDHEKEIASLKEQLEQLVKSMPFESWIFSVNFGDADLYKKHCAYMKLAYEARDKEVEHYIRMATQARREK